MTAEFSFSQVLEQELRQACDAFEHRLRNGERWRAEDCLREHPSLAADPDATLEILYFEYVLREELGQAPTARECFQRFPNLKAPLEKILKIHHSMGEMSVVCDSTIPATAPSTYSQFESVVQSRTSLPKRFGKYVLLEELGRGGMGVVYKAREPALDRLVAIKVILSGAHSGPAQLVQVHREARSLARLQHPNILQIFEIGEDQGRPYLCMEYVDGVGLDQLISRWKEKGGLGLSPEEAASLLETLARAVHYAHEQGIVHRDLKPANILVRVPKPDDGTFPIGDLPSNAAKIADFGLAKFVDGAAEATHAGRLVGTPSYMAPEQADCRTADVGPVTDVYSLGVILYELITGRVPFQGLNIQETLECVRTKDPTPPRQLQPHVPRDLETICLKCLEKEPKNRYSSALDLAEDLVRFQNGESIYALPATLTDRSVKWMRRRPVVASLLAALFLAVSLGSAGVIWQWHRAEQNAATAKQNARNLKYERDIAIKERHHAQNNLKIARESIDELSKIGSKLWWNPETNQAGKQLLDKVRNFYQTLLSEESSDPQVQLGMVLACEQVAYIHNIFGESDKAIETSGQGTNLLEKLLSSDPTNASYRLRLAESLRNRANFLRDRNHRDEALKTYYEAITQAEQVLDADPKNPHYQVNLANTLNNAVTVLSPRSDANEMESKCLRAMDLIRSAIQTCPECATYPIELALCKESLGLLYWRQQKPERAEEFMLECIDVLKKQFALGKVDRYSERYLGRAYNNLARIVASRNRSDEAEQLYDQAIEILEPLKRDYPGDIHLRQHLIDTINNKSGLLFRREKMTDAAELYRRSLTIDAKQCEVCNQLAWILATSTDFGPQQIDEAVRLAEVAVELQPNKGEYWNTFGVTLYRKGKAEQAIEAIEKATNTQKGGDSFDWYFLAMACWKLGTHDQARQWFDKAVEWHQRHPAQNQELDRFRAEAEAVLKDSVRFEASNAAADH